MRVALVTGSSGVIGRSVCSHMSAAGYSIAAHYRNSAFDSNQLLDQLTLGPEGIARSFNADLTSSRAAKTLVRQVLDCFGAIDVFVNCVGVVRDCLLPIMTDEEIDTVLDTNLKSAFYTIREVAKHMVARGSGVIINISSMAGQRPGRGQSNYSASKAGLEGLTRAVASELGPKGIRVNAIAPGIIESEMAARLLSNNRALIAQSTTLRRIGTASDVAHAVVFLASEQANFITGQVLNVDGGCARAW